MSYMKITIFAGMAFILASGCTTANPRIVSANDLGVTYRVKTDNQDAAREAAADHCRKWNRDAQLRSVTAAEGDRSIVRFACG